MSTTKPKTAKPKTAKPKGVDPIRQALDQIAYPAAMVQKLLRDLQDRDLTSKPVNVSKSELGTFVDWYFQQVRAMPVVGDLDEDLDD